MSAGYECPGDDRCLLLNDDVSTFDVEKTLGSLEWRWRWLLLGLPREAEAVVARYQEATRSLLADDALPIVDRGHRSEHLLSAAGRALADAGHVTPQAGTIECLFAGTGLPKQPRAVAEVWRRGLVGDVQRDERNHGRPSQALCIWSADVVEELMAEGHPIAPGHAGENLSVRGIDWSLVRPGSVMRIGGITCELSGWALPCAKNRRWFLQGPDGSKPEHRMDPDLHPGWSRAYAYVLTRENRGVEGTIRIGDAVTFE